MAFRRDSNYTVTSLSVSGLLHKRDLLPYKRGWANPFVLKSWDKQSAASANENTWFLCSSNTPLGDTGKSSIWKQKFSHETPFTGVIIYVRNTETTTKMETFIFLCPSKAVSTIPKSGWLEQIPMTASKLILYWSYIGQNHHLKTWWLSKNFFLYLRLKYRMKSSEMTEVECCRASMASVLPSTHFIQIHKFFTAVIRIARP